jgi:hypothetical protein
MKRLWLAQLQIHVLLIENFANVFSCFFFDARKKVLDYCVNASCLATESTETFDPAPAFGAGGNALFLCVLCGKNDFRKKLILE